MADDLSNLWANLSLSEREDEEVEIQAAEVTKIVRRGQFCIVGKLLGERMVSKETIKDTFKRWWRISGTFTFKIIGENLFLIEFEKAKDKRRVLDGRPWGFERNLFLVEDFDGRTAPTEFTFNKASFWVRMTNLPLACMGREVGFKLGASVGTVEEVDTDAEGIGWGEFLRVKISIDLYKPLPRGRMMKFEGKSNLIGFKYENLPKFCFHCGVICHGPEGCLKRNELRNQDDFTQYGPWLRATSPNRRGDRNHDRHEGRYSQTVAAEEWPKQVESTGQRNQNRRRRSDDTGKAAAGKKPHQESQQTNPPNFANGSMGMNVENKGGDFHSGTHAKKESINVGAIKEHFEFEFKSTRSKMREKSSLEGKEKLAIMNKKSTNSTPIKKLQLSPKGAWKAKEVLNKPNTVQQAVGLEGLFTNTGGPYTGLVLAEVEKTLQNAKEGPSAGKEDGSGSQGGKLSWKRKNRNELTESLTLGETPDSSYKKRVLGEEDILNGVAKKACTGSNVSDTNDGSGMAEAGEQPRRPQ
jgi:hypothetical protein